MSKDYKKLYEESIERARDLHDNHALGKPFIYETCEKIFPELRESEDERIRKGLIKGLSAMRDIHKHQTFSDDAINIDDAIAWLEKQGEQKPKEKPKIYNSMDDLIADALIEEIETSELPESSKHNRIYWINKHRQKSIEQDTETRDLWVYIREWREKFGRFPKDEDELASCMDYVIKRQKHSWSEKHIADVFEKVGLARIVREQGNDQLTNAVQSAMIELSKQHNFSSWSEEDEKFYISALWHIKNSCGNGGKDSGEYEVYNWLKSIKDRVQPQPQSKQEWSEEDKNRFNNLIHLIENSNEGKGTKEGFIKFINRIKSLKPQNKWKPSEEQLRAILNSVQGLYQCKEKEVLLDLYEQLKKL